MPEWTPRRSRPASCSTSRASCADIDAYEAYGGYAQLRRAMAGMDADDRSLQLGGRRACAAAAGPASRPAAR